MGGDCGRLERLVNFALWVLFPFDQGSFMSIREDFVHVRAAAKILGVAPNTVRAWGAAGKIPEYRHPMNGYRLYRREDLESVLQKLEQPRSPTAKVAEG